MTVSFLVIRIEQKDNWYGMRYRNSCWLYQIKKSFVSLTVRSEDRVFSSVLYSFYDTIDQQSFSLKTTLKVNNIVCRRRWLGFPKIRNIPPCFRRNFVGYLLSEWNILDSHYKHYNFIEYMNYSDHKNVRENT